jgi:hypothetical protein
MQREFRAKEVRRHDSPVLPLFDRGMLWTPARVLDLMCPACCTNEKVTRLDPSALIWLRIGLPKISVGGVPKQVVTTIGRQLGLLLIFGWSLPFLRMQPGRSHNCLTKLLERHLCFVCAGRSFF